MTDVQNLISILPNHRSNAIHALEIAQQLGFPTGGNQVETRALIRYAIQQGHTIISNTRIGYWISNDANEIQSYIDSLQSRADDTALRSDEIRDAWNQRNPNSQI